MANIETTDRNVIINQLKKLLRQNEIELNGTGVSFSEYGFTIPAQYDSSKLMAMLRANATFHIVSDSWGSDINLITLAI